MNIRNEAPPADATIDRRNISHQPVIEAILKGNGEWIAVDLRELPGRTPKMKRAYVLSAARYRGRNIQTTIVDSTLYMRLIVGIGEAAHG